MSIRIVQFFIIAAWIFSFIFTVYICYYLILAIFSLKKQKRKKQYAPLNKFAIVIAARNEERVIPFLIESLSMQNYPKELYDVYVIPNNCTDQTKQVSLQAGAQVLNCTTVIKNKGDVLSYAFDQLLKDKDGYDAFCVFDADNLVHPDFLRQMNNALISGAKLAQGYRDSKNPYDSAISGCYSIYYWMINRFYSWARSSVGMSALINGTGFMVKTEVLREMNGFHTVTQTEDLEFTTQCILRGVKVWWVPEAIVFDEQPLTFLDSWKQRKRWSTGCIQGLFYYFTPLWEKVVKERNFQCVDQIMFYLTPVIQIVYLLSLLMHFILHILYVQYPLFPNAQLYYRLFLSVYYSYIMVTTGVLLILVLEKRLSRRLIKGIFAYWIFIMSWIPINIICFFKKHTNWDEIKHKKSIHLNEIITVKGKT
jgi:cellulose synthase/poly-beta-1,6-N-acetylglucosamine synthase-like glycosyltransferase